MSTTVKKLFSLLPPSSRLKTFNHFTKNCDKDLRPNNINYHRHPLIARSSPFSCSSTIPIYSTNQKHQQGSNSPASDDATSKDSQHHYSISNYLPSIRSLASKLPSSHLKQRLTPSDLLPLAQSRLERIKIRWKWLTIRSFRAYRSDDYSAFASLFVVLNLFLAGIFTTTFLGVLICLFNKAGMEDFLANWLSDKMSRSMGVTIVFGSALVPRWSDGIIRFSNVWVSRTGPSSPPYPILGTDKEDQSPKSLVEEMIQLIIRANQVILPDLSDQDQEPNLSTSPNDPQNQPNGQLSDDYTHFHLSIASIDVTLSLGRWLDGKGLIKSAQLSGIRGVIDRSHIPVSTNQDMDAQPIDRKSWRKKPSAGDFHLESVTVDDLLLTIFQPNSFRPYTFSIFNAHFNKLRRQWLFLDLMSADQITGQLDHCLFSVHKPQSILTSSNSIIEDYEDQPSTSPGPSSKRKFQTRLSRFRIDGVPIDHFKPSGNPDDLVGPISWIQSGRVDVIADIRLPLESEEIDLKRVVKEIVDNFEKEIVNNQNSNGSKRHHDPSKRITERRELIKPALEVPSTASLENGLGSSHVLTTRRRSHDDDNDYNANENFSDGEDEGEFNRLDERVVIDLDLRFKDVKASVPMFDSSLTYVNTALVRSIVAFINANRTLIPIKCQVKLDLEEFNGSWTTFDVGLIESISEQVYEALAYHVGSDDVARSNRISHLSRWGISLTANAILDILKHHWESPH